MTAASAHKLYQVTRDGSPVSPVLPTYNDAFGWVLRNTPVSFHHATTYEGYAVAEIIESEHPELIEKC